jgi:hypothetical protein
MAEMHWRHGVARGTEAAVRADMATEQRGKGRAGAGAGAGTGVVAVAGSGGAGGTW